MSRFHLAERIEQEQNFQEKQLKLKQKYEIKDQDVIVVEKSNMYKFTIRLIVSFIKVVSTIILLILALTGITALVYPIPRVAMQQVLQEIWVQFCNMMM